jgi:CRP-like cAMP-binding protein
MVTGTKGPLVATVVTAPQPDRSGVSKPEFPHARHNQLLHALPISDFERVAPHLQPVALNRGEVLYEIESLLRFVYFPTTSLISLQYDLMNGDSTEIAMVGKEGMLGVSLLLGDNSTSCRAVVQSAGAAYRLRAEALNAEVARAGPMMYHLLRYTQALITQMVQYAACNRYHSIDQQLCRWLLLSLDRLQSTELLMTHEVIARMLGVRREGVTQAAEKLRATGLIRYRRGRISILNRSGLEARSCECYRAVKSEYDRLVPHGPSSLSAGS